VGAVLQLSEVTFLAVQLAIVLRRSSDEAIFSRDFYVTLICIRILCSGSSFLQDCTFFYDVVLLLLLLLLLFLLLLLLSNI
jgi:hypothetical protein